MNFNEFLIDYEDHLLAEQVGFLYKLVAAGYCNNLEVKVKGKVSSSLASLEFTEDYSVATIRAYDPFGSNYKFVFKLKRNEDANPTRCREITYKT